MAVSPAEDVVRFGLFELDLKTGQLAGTGPNFPCPNNRCRSWRSSSNARVRSSLATNFANAFGPQMSSSTLTTD